MAGKPDLFIALDCGTNSHAEALFLRELGVDVMVIDHHRSKEQPLEQCLLINPHVHPGGEEILVLEGVFYDEHGDYPAGSWLRNPRYSEHTPFTGKEGALIYVKVGHIDAGLLGDKFIT